MLTPNIKISSSYIFTILLYISGVLDQEFPLFRKYFFVYNICLIFKQNLTNENNFIL